MSLGKGEGLRESDYIWAGDGVGGEVEASTTSEPT